MISPTLPASAQEYLHKTDAPPHAKHADFKQERASPEAQQIADWVVVSDDNGTMPFMIVDKKAAKVFVFNSTGQLRGASPALLGFARGDDSVPGIGKMKLSSIRPEQRTTPAGRFVASRGQNVQGEEILWVDYELALSVHRVITSKTKDHRVQRLNSPTARDNRITYGCINVSAAFYDTVVRPAFTGTNGIVYILPEIRKSRDVFRMYGTEEQERQR
jgi:hypothetical protein